MENTAYLFEILLAGTFLSTVTSFRDYPEYQVKSNWCNFKSSNSEFDYNNSIDAVNEKSQLKFKCKCTKMLFRCFDLSKTYRSKYLSKSIVVEPSGSRSWYMKCNIGSRDISIVDSLRGLNLDKVSTLSINDCYTPSYQKLLSHLGVSAINKLILRAHDVEMKLDGCSFRDIGRSYPMIKELELHSEGIKSISSDALIDLKTLKALRIHRTSIRLFPDSLLFPLPDLRKISIFWNQDLDGLPRKLFHKNAKLEKILINNNQGLTRLNPDQFRGLRKLEDLDLGSNQFKVIPANLFAFDNNSDFSRLEAFKILEDTCGMNCYRKMPENLLAELRNLKSFRYSTKYGTKKRKNEMIFPSNFVIPSSITTVQINRANLMKMILKV